MKTCITCGAEFAPKQPHSSTCGRACRVRLVERLKAHGMVKEKPMPQHERTLAKLAEKLPEVAAELRALQVIYGWDAFEHALKAVSLVGEHFNPPRQRALQVRIDADKGMSAA
jgi:hypothetical protein